MKFRLSPMALAVFALQSMSASAQDAASAAAPEAATQLKEVKVEATADNPYRAPVSASSKYTEPLRDVPQTVQVLPGQLIEDQNQLTLRQMLSNVPGITFGAAEGGAGFGDNITFRGSRIENDIQLDGIRDSAQTARTDPFNLEQLEVTKGASSVYSGSGAVTGTINQISKTAKAEDFSKLSLGAGTDQYQRFTADANRKLSESSAARLNLMTHRNDSPERDEVWFERWGVAPSLAFGLGTDTRTTINVLHQENERVPDRGILWRRAVSPGEGKPVPVDRSTYFGFSNVDRENATVDVFTASIEKDISPALTLRNTTRHGRTRNDSTVATLNGLVCVDGVPFEATGTCPTPGADTWTPSGNSLIPGNRRDDLTTLTANVTELRWTVQTAGIEHAIVAGLALTREGFDRDLKQARKADGSAYDTTATDLDGLAAAATVDLNKPQRIWTGPLNWVTTTRNENQLNNQALYVFDTLKFSEAWQLSAGLRAERNEANYRTFDVAGIGTTTDADSKDTLISGRLGVVYKPGANSSVYLAYGNSEAPSATSVIASCAATGANQNCNLDPEQTKSYELGTKWDLLDQQLSLSAAVFRNDRTNARINSGDPVITVQVLDGQSRVDGIELSASGQLTAQWSVYAGLALLDSEVLQSVSNAQQASNVLDAQKGEQIPNTPKQSGSLWTSYRLPAGFEIGYGLSFTGAYKTEANALTTTVPSATVQNALVGWRASRHLNLRLNINNLANERYWSAVRPHGWAHPGEGRSAVLTAHCEF